MGSHSNKQLVILKTMGVEVWKLRHSSEVVELPDSEYTVTVSSPSENIPNQVVTSSSKQPNFPATAEPAEIDSNPDVAFVERKNLASQSEEIANPDQGVTSSTTNVVQSNSGTEVGRKVVDWHTSVSRQSGAKWCFVCAMSNENTAAEKKLFDAIAFALELVPSDYHVIQSFPMTEEISESTVVSGIKECLPSVIEEEQPSHVVIFGEELAQFLIETDKPIDVLRSESYRYQGGKSSLYITFGLDHLLTHPSDKLFAWQDLVKAKKTIH